MICLRYGAATSDRTEFNPTPAAINGLTAFTAMILCRPTTLTLNRTIFRKDVVAGSAAAKILRFGNTAGSTADGFKITIVRATTNADADTTTGIVTLDEWQWLCVAWDGTNAPTLGRGTLVSPIIDVTSTSNAGSGAHAVTDDALRIGNQTGAAPAAAVQGDIYRVVFFTRALTLGEMIRVQFGTPSDHPDCRFWTDLDSYPPPRDFTSGLTGVTTGATLAPSYPLTIPRRPRGFAADVAAQAFVITADSGTYFLTGTAANTLKGSLISTASGSYTLSGTAATLNKGFTLIADAGAYALTGATAALLKGSRVAADAGSYAITGTAATLARVLTLVADAGAYAITGSTVNFLRTYVLQAAAGSYSLVGAAVNLIYSAAVATGGVWPWFTRKNRR